MRDYFKRLREHSGIGTAIAMSVLGTLAGAANKSSEVIWHGALFGFIVTGVIAWTIILLTNGKNK